MNIANSTNAYANALAMHANSSSAASPQSGTPTDPSTITSSDFLTLLVTQMKNQDPTQPTDPTAYVQQLVGVNSLEQLIDINQQLSSRGQASPSGAQATGAPSSFTAGTPETSSSAGA